MTSLRASRGFTFLELLIVLAILGILAAVAIPAYQQYVRDTAMRQLAPQPVLQAYLQKADFTLLPEVSRIECDNYRKPQFSCAVALGASDSGRHFDIGSNALGLDIPKSPLLFRIERAQGGSTEVLAYVDRASVTPEVAGQLTLALAKAAQATVAVERAQLAQDQARIAAQTAAATESERAWAAAEQKLLLAK